MKLTKGVLHDKDFDLGLFVSGDVKQGNDNDVVDVVVDGELNFRMLVWMLNHRSVCLPPGEDLVLDGSVMVIG